MKDANDASFVVVQYLKYAEIATKFRIFKSMEAQSFWI
jgi:hypothetical protein